MNNLPNTSGGKDPFKQYANVLSLGATLSIYRGHSSETGVLAVAWSPDGQRIASAGKDHTVQVWDAATGDTIFTYHEHVKGVEAIAWSLDGQCIASGSDDDTVRVWRAIT